MVAGGKTGDTPLDTTEILEIDYSGGTLTIGPDWSSSQALSEALGPTTMAEDTSTRTLYVLSGKGLDDFSTKMYRITWPPGQAAPNAWEEVSQSVAVARLGHAAFRVPQSLTNLCP